LQVSLVAEKRPARNAGIDSLSAKRATGEQLQAADALDHRGDRLSLAEASHPYRVRRLLGDGCKLSPTRQSLLGQVPDSSYRRGRHITWFHLHKFGGTTMCQLAQAQRERTPWPEMNCNLEEVSERKAKKHVLCEARSTSPCYSFSAIERFVTAGDTSCSDSVYGVMLRDPLEGARSHLSFHKFTAQDKQALVRNLNSTTSQGDNPSWLQWETNHVPTWDTYQHVDNFATRTLSGRYDAPPRGVLEEDFEAAKVTLRQMDVILILEEFANHAPQLEHFFGWHLRKTALEQHKNSQQGSTNGVFTREEEEFVKDLNHFDYRLYAFARELASQRTEAARLALQPSL